MSNGAWTDEENDLIVADYFVMLSKDNFACPYSKAKHGCWFCSPNATRSPVF
jgi:hypothetical protein